MKLAVFLLIFLSGTSGLAAAENYSCSAAWPVQYGIVPATLRLSPAEVDGVFSIEIDGRPDQPVGKIENIQVFHKGVDSEAVLFSEWLNKLSPDIYLNIQSADSIRVFDIKINNGNTAQFFQLFVGQKPLINLLSGGDARVSCLTDNPTR